MISIIAMSLILWYVADWEAVADRAPDELLPSHCLSEFSNLKLDNTKNETPKRRGRGTFSYEKRELYSDQLLDNSVIEVGDEKTDPTSGVKKDMTNCESNLLVISVIH